MSPIRLRISVLALASAAVVVAAALWSPLFALYRVSGTSMLPSLEDGDSVLVTTLPTLFGGIDLGDTVIAEVDGEVLIKRVMGLPGDVLRLEDGHVYRGLAELQDPVPPPFRDHSSLGPCRLAPDEYFVLGDNRCVSVDSRAFGALPRPQILGKVLYRFPAGHPKGTATAASR